MKILPAIAGNTNPKRQRRGQFIASLALRVSIGMLNFARSRHKILTFALAVWTSWLISGSAALAEQPRRFNFENDIVPILSKFGCNSSGCHGKAEGQNGFKLSVFGFDPPADYTALLKEGRGRRVFPAAPEHSLLLRKMSGQMAHACGG